MSFYDHLRPYYDLVFPVKSASVDFLASQFVQDNAYKILDVACGTGSHAIGLADRGFSVVGVDLHEGMVADARIKAKAAEHPLRFEVLDMRNVDPVSLGHWDGVYCIGNSLPHLTKDDETRAAVEKWQQGMVSKAKTLIIQVVNFAGVLNRGGSLPTLTGESNGSKVTFERRYEPAQASNLFFVTTLTISSPEASQTWTDKTLLRPLSQEYLHTLLSELDYCDFQWFGDLTGKPLTEDSPAVVVVARQR